MLNWQLYLPEYLKSNREHKEHKGPFGWLYLTCFAGTLANVQSEGSQASGPLTGEVQSQIWSCCAGMVLGYRQLGVPVGAIC